MNEAKMQLHHEVEQLKREITRLTREKEQLAKKHELEKVLGQTLKETTPVGSYTLDLETDEAVWNSEMHRICDWPLSQKPPGSEQFLQELIHAEDKAYLTRVIEETVSRRKPFDIIYRIMTRKGETRLVHTMGKPLLDEHGRVTTIFGAMYDITHTQHAQMTLAERERFITAVITAGPSIVYVFDLIENRNVYANRLIGEILGYPPEEVRAMGDAVLPTLIHPDDMPRVADYLQGLQTLTDGEVRNVEYRMCAVDGRYRWLHSFETILNRTPDGRVKQIVGAAYDINQRKEAEAELAEYRLHLEKLVKARTTALEKANRRLEDLSRIKDEFVANVSHELRSPITSLKLRQDLLRQQPEQAEKHLDVMRRETERLERTIEDLLSLSRLNQVKQDIHLLHLDLNELIDHYVKDRQPLAESQALALDFQPAPDPILVKADPGLMGQVLGILLNNALTYTPAGGAVVVRTAVRPRDGKRYAGFIVDDTGPGVTAAEQTHLFERFYRGRVAKATGGGGAGLGLAIAKEIIDRHSGLIEVKSSGVPGEGAAFKVWLPIAAGQGA